MPHSPAIPAPPDWRVMRLQDLTTKIGSGATPTGGQEAYLPERKRFALIRSQNVFDRRFDQTGLAYISDEQAARLTGAALEEGDVLLNITGDGVTFGRACMVPHDVLPACVNQHVTIIRTDCREADPRFVLAFLTHPQVKPYIEGFNAGGSRRAITKGHIENFILALPTINEQRVIGDLLGVLDDKIELNRRMNETLEAMARAMFQDWFVAFGPTRAKMEGRSPYLAPDLWALFPDRLDAEGQPEGWRAGALLDLCELKRGYDLPAARRVPGPVPIVSSSGITDHHDTAMADGPGVVTGRYGTIGDVFFLERPYWPLNTALYVRDFRGNSPRFVFYTLRLLDFNQYSDKGAVPGVNRNDLHRAPAIVPPPTVQEAFDQLLAPSWARMAANDHECATLAATRDLLLPRLMSGEVRVKDAEKIASAAA